MLVSKVLVLMVRGLINLQLRTVLTFKPMWIVQRTFTTPLLISFKSFDVKLDAGKQ